MGAWANIGLAVAGLGFVSASVARAQEEVSVSPAATPAPAGNYQGVCPGTDHPPAVAPKRTSGNVITWPGFQMLPGGGSRVFVQSTGPISTGTHTAESKLFVSLGPARLAHKNNGRPLVTRYFNTPVVEASIETRGRQATLVLSLRAAVQPAISSEHVAATGYHFVYIDFPPGQYLDGPAVSAAPPAAAAPPPATLPPAPPPVPDDMPAYLRGNASGSASGSSGAGTVEAEGKAKGNVSIGF